MLAAISAAKGTASAADNLILQRAYSYFPEPSYADCRDDGDKVQLTDGRTQYAGNMWTNASCLGWASGVDVPIVIHFDRGEEATLQELRFNTCPMRSLSCSPSRNPFARHSFELLSSGGRRLWLYHAADSFFGSGRERDPLSVYRLMHWLAFRHGACGVGFWNMLHNGTSAWQEGENRQYYPMVYDDPATERGTTAGT